MVDDDQDGVINADDNCPFVANLDQHDEDADGYGDACDLCPLGVETRDSDCDGVGDSCDPDNARPDTLQFLGFGTANGVTLSDPTTTMVRVEADALFMPKEVGYGFAIVNEPVAYFGIYETSFDVTAYSTGSYDVQLRWGSSNVAIPDDGYYALLYAGSGLPNRLEVGVIVAGALNPITSVGVTSSELGHFTLRVTVTADLVRVVLSDGASVMSTLDLTPDMAPIHPSPSRFSLRGHRADVAFQYLSRTGPAL